MIRPSATVKAKATRGRPPGAQTAPTAPSTSGPGPPGEAPGHGGGAPDLAVGARGHRRGVGADDTSGSSRASSAWKSPSREAARNASTTARCRPRSAPGPDGAWPDRLGQQRLLLGTDLLGRPVGRLHAKGRA